RDFKSLVSTDFTIWAEYGGASRSRTEVHGFAIRCMATLPTRVGAGNETRTRHPDLGKVVLYQLSYSRISELTDLRICFLKPLCRSDALHSTDFTLSVNRLIHEK